MTKIKITGTKTNRQLAQQYERVGVYRVSPADMSFLVHTLLSVFYRLSDHYPSLKSGEWEFDFTKRIDFQAIGYSDISGWKMLMFVENETKGYADITFAFSGMAAIPYLTCKNPETLFLKGPEMIIPMVEVDVAKAPPPKPKKLSRWQRFKNWFRWNRSSSGSSSSPSVLGDIGDAIGDIISD